MRVKSQKQKERDSTRIQGYLERKRSLQALPFSGVRNSTFINSLDISSVLKSELNRVRQKLAEEKIRNLQQENIVKDLCAKLQYVNSEKDQLCKDVANLKQQSHQIVPTEIGAFINKIETLQQSLTSKDNLISIIRERYDEQYQEYNSKYKQWECEQNILFTKIDEHRKAVEHLSDQICDLESQNQSLQISLQYQQQINNNRHFNSNRRGRTLREAEAYVTKQNG